MSRELQEKADVVIRELKEALLPLREELLKFKRGQNADESRRFE